jgi:hypothetical protein
MTDLSPADHPITPPPELVKKWVNEALNLFSDDKYLQLRAVDDARGPHIAALAARWGADQELEACCEWVEDECPGYGRPYEKLRSARRPKPLSLKEQALAALDEAQAEMSRVNYKTIRAVLEQLDD